MKIGPHVFPKFGTQTDKAGNYIEGGFDTFNGTPIVSEDYDLLLLHCVLKKQYT